MSNRPDECGVCGRVYFGSTCPDGPHSWKDQYDLPDDTHFADQTSSVYDNRHGADFEEARRAALRRHGWKCAHCGMTDSEHRGREDYWPPFGGLHVHHIIPAKQFESPDRSHLVMNLVPLCDKCHKQETADEG